MNLARLGSAWQGLAPQLLSVLRVVAALIFVQAGTVKLFAFPIGMPPSGGTASFPSQVWIGGLLEVAGGALLAVGLFTRPVAFVLSGMMAVAYFQFHFPGGFWPAVNGGTAAALYSFVWLYVSAAGPGPWSIDAWRRRAGSRGDAQRIDELKSMLGKVKLEIDLPRSRRRPRGRS